MIEIIIGRAGTGKSFACLQAIKKILTDSPLQTEIIYILPDYQTYRAEQDLSKLTGGYFNTRMESIQRFARQILEEVGGATLPRISELGRRMLLKKILLHRDKKEDLKYFHRAARQRGFAESLADQIKELRSYSIEPEDLRLFSEMMLPENPELADKISDLAILTEDFRNEIAGKQNDNEDLLKKAALLAEKSESLKRTEIFIDGFIFFNPQQRKFLKQLMKIAKNIHIVLPMEPELNHTENTRPAGLFNRSFRTFETLKPRLKL